MLSASPWSPRAVRATPAEPPQAAVGPSEFQTRNGCTSSFAGGRERRTPAAGQGSGSAWYRYERMFEPDHPQKIGTEEVATCHLRRKNHAEQADQQVAMGGSSDLAKVERAPFQRSVPDQMNNKWSLRLSMARRLKAAPAPRSKAGRIFTRKPASLIADVARCTAATSSVSIATNISMASPCSQG